MSREIEFRAWDIINNSYIFNYLDSYKFEEHRFVNDNYIIEQYTGLKDINGTNIFVWDILKFENGDTFKICCEDWLNLYVEWIGEPECEDQVRDIYRIESAELIGNIHQHKQLLEGE